MEIQQGEKLHPVKLKICLTEPNLLSQIRDGIKLHPMIKTSASSNSSEDLPRLLDQIRAGVVLRPVTERGSIEDGELEGNGERTGERREEILKKSMDSSRMVKGLESGSQTRKISRDFFTIMGPSLLQINI